MTNPLPRPFRSAFTLIEILIVMGIIVLLIAIALPTFNFITGARSVEAATNLASSTLGVARANAVGLQQTQGVVFYRDAATDRVAMSLVEVRTTPFQTWTAGLPSPAAPTLHKQGEYVVQGANAYVCIQDHEDPAPTPVGPVLLTNTTYWRPMPSAAPLIALPGSVSIIEAVGNTERQLLPVGVNARTAGNNVLDTLTGTTYRYFNPGVVLFDSNGQITVQRYFVLQEGIIGNQMNIKTAVPLPGTNKPLGYTTATPATSLLSSHIGFVFFSDEQYANATSNYPTASQPTLQAALDAWIDQNGTPVMLNRYNGTLVKGE